MFCIFINVPSFEPNMAKKSLPLDKRTCPNCNNMFEVKHYNKKTFCCGKCAQHYTKSKNRDWLEKRDETNLDKFGVKSPLQSPQVLQTYKNNMIKKYGVDNPFLVTEFKEKSDKSILEKYGTKVASQNSEISHKISKTLKGRVIDRERFVHVKWEKLEAYHQHSKMKPLFDREYLEDNKLNHSFKNKFRFVCENCNSITEVYLSNGYLPSCDCSNYKGYSLIEDELNVFLNELGVVNILNNRRDLLPNRLEIDIYLPDYNLAIEVNGVYWHSESMGKYKNYHLYKTEECNKVGVELIHILDFEWIFKKPLIQSIIINKLKLNIKKIFARKCKIKVIDNVVLKEFLNLNHIQGYTHSPINIGLYYQDNLISVMTFGKNRFKKLSNEWEMIRFCSLKGMSVVGGASRLFKYFLKNYNSQNYNIISFADRRFFNGGLYKGLGFEFESNTNPSYIYWKNNIIKSRMSCQKHKLEKLIEIFNPELTEYQNMINNGWRRVWDCGNIKFIFRV